MAGYPSRILGYFLGGKYTTVSGLAFRVYRLIPLLPELREVMDWMFTDTSLPLLHWLRVQEIYAQIYLVKVRRESQKVREQSHKELAAFTVYSSIAEVSPRPW